MSGIDTYTKLMLHMDGADASTTFTDSSLSPRTVTAVGNAQIDTAQSKFGGAAGLFDGTGDLLTCADSADFAFGTGDFTIDFWLRLANDAVGQTLITKRVGQPYCPFWIHVGSQQVIFNASSTGSSWDIASEVAFGSVTTATWYHVEVVRTGSTFYGFLDGARTTLGTSSASLLANSDLLRIGSDSASYGLNGWLDELRVSKGIARHTSTFTPETSAYSENVDELRTWRNVEAGAVGPPAVVMEQARVGFIGGYAGRG